MLVCGELFLSSPGFSSLATCTNEENNNENNNDVIIIAVLTITKR